ncbi:MAG: hypothetical protein J0M29_17870 [Chitinophagales bacterium]|nr:hypothetical protein [Chitinophagales bacterium]
MTTLETAFEVKDEILFLLSKEKNLKHLEQIRAYIAELVIGEGDLDWWDELPLDAQDRLKRIRDEMRRGENVVPHNEAKKKLNLGRHANRMVG